MTRKQQDRNRDFSTKKPGKDSVRITFASENDRDW